MSDVTNNNYYPEDKSYVYVPDTIGPGGKSFFVTSAELIEYNDPEDGKSPNGYQLINDEMQEKSLYAKIKSLSQDLHQFNQIFNGIPTFKITSTIPNQYELNTTLSFNILIDSVTTNECRIQVKRLKRGTNNYTTFTYTCYPGQDFPTVLPAIVDIGTYTYTISATCGSKRCATEDSINDTPIYEMSFDVSYGTASLTLPNFTSSNKQTIYSFNTNIDLMLDCYYTASQDIKDYKITVSLYHPNDLINPIITKPYNSTGDYKSGTEIKTIINDFPIRIENKNNATNEAYLLKIESEGLNVQNTYISKEFWLDFMEEGAVIQNINNFSVYWGSNDSLNFNFTPKVNSGALVNTYLDYICYLEYIDNSGEKIQIYPINRSIKAQHLKPTKINFDKFINIDANLKNDTLYPIGSTKKYDLVLVCDSSYIDSGKRQQSRIEITVTKDEDNTNDYETERLILDFDFSQSYGADSIIQNQVTDSKYSKYSLKLIGGVAEDLQMINQEIETADTHLVGESDQSSYFNFKKGQGAILINTDNNDLINPMVHLGPLVDEKPSGYTIEMFYRNNYLGDLNAIAASINQTFAGDKTLNQDGILIPVGSAKVSYSGTSAKATFRQDCWRHLAIVIKQFEEEETKNNITTKTNVIQTKIYNNGVLEGFDEYRGNFNPTYGDNPLTLNGCYDAATSTLTNSGSMDIKYLRYYNYPWEDQTIYKNYITSFTKPSYKEVIELRNDATSVINVFFIANASNPQDPKDKKQNDTNKVKHYINFEALNKLDKKKPDRDEAASSNSAVNCTMIYSYYDATQDKTVTIPYTNVDVYLQGTSSLKYPVKNYQIKVYENNNPGTKLKIQPPKANWLTTSNVYTLKCDYMEQSHRNNTPTAGYYQDCVLDNVINFVKEETTYYSENIIKNSDDPYYCDVQNNYIPYSVARRVENSQNEPIYRDAIDGIPCIVYYSDKYYTANKNIKEENIDIEELVKDSKTKCAGSFMFNVDKTGDQLGFKIEPNDIEIQDKTDYIKTIDNTTYIKVDPNTGKIDKNSNILVEYLPCISYEGATNENVSAAAFVPFEDQRYLYLKSIWDNNQSIDAQGRKKFTLRQVKQDDFNRWQYELNEEDDSLIEDKSYSIIFTSFGEQADLNNPLSQEQFETKFAEDCVEEAKTRTFTNISFLNYITSKYHDSIAELDNAFNRALYICYTQDEHKEVYGTDWEDYINKTLEPRFNFVDKLEFKLLENNQLKDYNLPDEDKINMTITIMKEAIEWVYSCFEQLESENENIQKLGKEDFRKDFSKYFSFEYCLAYFLQMMLFAQVDNAGKNAMFDTWGNGKLYPRPYDMDTQVGLDNTGFDRIDVSAELNPIFSPMFSYSGISSSMQVANGATHRRFNSYNTSNSALWKSFALTFKDEIAKCYKRLRDNNVYNLDAINSYVNSKTRDQIGEIYYNQDANNKYLNNQTYIQCLQGSRQDRYYNFLKERLVFLDTYFDYCPTGQANTNILLRANTEIGDSLIIHPLSPMYVRVAIENDGTTCLVTPEDTYKDENGNTCKGNKFTFLASNASNKNMYISGDYNLLEIEGLDKIKLEQLTLQSPDNLINLNISGATEVTKVNIGNAHNLQNINLSGCQKMSGTLNLSNCSNIENLNISNTNIETIVFPEGTCNLQSLNCFEARALRELELFNMPNLIKENLILTTTPALTTLRLENCNSLTSFIDDAYYESAELENNFLKALTNLSIRNCANFKSLSLINRNLKTLELSFIDDGLETLDLHGCQGEAFNILNLSNCKNLKHFKLNDIIPSGEAKIILGNINPIEYLTLNNSNFKTLYHNNTNDIEVNCFNFENIEFKDNATLLLKGNKKVQKINNLTYTGQLSYLFQGNEELISIDNSALTLGDKQKSISYMFENCYKLQDFKDCEFSLDNLKNTATTNPKTNGVTHTFHTCKSLTSEAFNCLVSSLPEGIHTIGQLAQSAFSETKGGFVLSGCTFPSSLTTAETAFTHSGIVKIESDVFSKCKQLTNITQTFYDCSKLTTVTSQLLKECPLVNARAAFHNCIELTSNLTGLLEKTTLENIAYIFSTCKKMTSGTTDPINLSNYFKNLTNLKHATGAFYNTPELSIKFDEDYILNSKNIISVAGMLAKSGLKKIPQYLYNPNSAEIPTGFLHAQGLFSNVVPTDDTYIYKDFFNKCGSLQYIGNHSSIPQETEYQYAGGYKVSIGGIFANIPNLWIENNVFEKLPNLKNISHAFFIGNSTTDDYSSKEGYLGRSVTDVNSKNYSNEYMCKFFIKTTSNSGEQIIEEIDTDISLFGNETISPTNAAYLFAGNKNIENLSSILVDTHLANCTTLEGMLSNCINFTGSNNVFIKLVQNKPSVTNMAHLFENCFNLTQSFTNLDLFGNITKPTDCRYMFKGSNITGEIWVNLFDKFRDKIKYTSHMFAKCSGLTKIQQGKATNFNIPDKYDNSDLHYYFDFYCPKEDYSSYDDFKNDINNYFENHKSNWYGTGSSFDRYRNHIEELLYKYREFDEENGQFKVKIKLKDATQETDIILPNGLTEEMLNQFSMGGATLPPKDNVSTFIVDIPSKYGYYSLHNIYDIEQSGLLGGCVELAEIDYMFAGCCGLKGNIPADLFSSKDNKKLENLYSLTGLFAGCCNLTLIGTPINVEGQNYLFKEIETNKEYNTTVFDSIQNEFITLNTGGNFKQVYPVAYYDNNRKLKIYESNNLEDSGKYFIPIDWTNNLSSSITNIENIFCGIGNPIKPFYSDDKKLIHISRIYPMTGINKPIYPMLKLDNSVFKNLKKLKNANSAFRSISTIFDTTLSDNFLNSSSSSLQSIQYLFKNTPLRGVNKPFSNATQLKNIKQCFQGMYLLWNGNAGTSALYYLYDTLFETDSGTPLPSSIYNGEAYGSYGRKYGNNATANPPEFWNLTQIITSEKRSSLDSFSRPDNQEELWFYTLEPHVYSDQLTDFITIIP